MATEQRMFKTDAKGYQQLAHCNNCALLFDHLVGGHQQRLRDRQP
jgi:hypothetical protein